MKQDVRLEARGVHFSGEREEAYFTATFTLPRVGEVSATYIADRYLARVWDGPNGKGRNAWTQWRVIRQNSIAGVGEKTLPKVREMVEPMILAWLGSEAYVAARKAALANYVIRTLQDGRYGLSSGKRALDAHRAELTYFDHTRIAQAIDHLEKAESLLSDEQAATDAA